MSLDSVVGQLTCTLCPRRMAACQQQHDGHGGHGGHGGDSHHPAYIGKCTDTGTCALCISARAKRPMHTHGRAHTQRQ